MASPTLEVYRKSLLLVGLCVVASTLPLAILRHGLGTLFSHDSRWQ